MRVGGVGENDQTRVKNPFLCVCVCAVFHPPLANSNMCVCACVRACVHACVHANVHVCMRRCMCVGGGGGDIIAVIKHVGCVIVIKEY